LSRSAFVVSLESLLGALRPAFTSVARHLQITPQKSAGGDSAASLGVTFLDIAKQAGLNAKTIYGG
jgi:hypothetical protein